MVKPWDCGSQDAGSSPAPLITGSLTPSADQPDGTRTYGSEIPGNAEERPGGWTATDMGALPEPS